MIIHLQLLRWLCRKEEQKTLQQVLAFLQLEEATPAQLDAMANTKANRGHSTISKTKGCGFHGAPLISCSVVCEIASAHVHVCHECCLRVRVFKSGPCTLHGRCNVMAA